MRGERRMKTRYFIRGLLAESYEEYKKIKMLYNNDNFTEKFIKSHVNSSIHNPIFYNGFWIKYNGKTKFYSGDENECTLRDLYNCNVMLEIYINKYDYCGKNGWNMTCTKITKL